MTACYLPILPPNLAVHALTPHLGNNSPAPPLYLFQLRATHLTHPFASTGDYSSSSIEECGIAQIGSLLNDIITLRGSNNIYLKRTMKGWMVNKANLLDMFGLSGDPATDDELGALLFRLESETGPNLSDTDPMAGIFSSRTYLQFDA